MDENLLQSVENVNDFNILSGITVGGYKKDGYFFAWQFNEETQLFILLKILIINNKPKVFHLVTVPIGKQLKFTIDKRRQYHIGWRISILSGDIYKSMVNNVTEVKNHRLWGIKINGIKNIVIRSSDIKSGDIRKEIIKNPYNEEN
ncbi:MAG: hypothetical protein WCH34_19095 [Bacteroidota bacterium]